MSDGEEEYDRLDMFYEEDPPTPKPVYERFTRINGQTLQIRLVGASPLWGHLLWSAGKVLANYIDERPEIVRDKRVLELGAAGALPSIICSLNHAKTVVITDYPDPDLLENIQRNIDHCSNASESTTVTCQGYIWGRETTELLREAQDELFDLLILSDLLFNHQAHRDLLKTCKECLSCRTASQILVFFTHHRPHLADKDDNFFKLAVEYDFVVEKVVEDQSEANIMFAEDGGSKEVRATVHGYRLTHKDKDNRGCN